MVWKGNVQPCFVMPINLTFRHLTKLCVSAGEGRGHQGQEAPHHRVGMTELEIALRMYYRMEVLTDHLIM